MIEAQRVLEHCCSQWSIVLGASKQEPYRSLLGRETRPESIAVGVVDLWGISARLHSIWLCCHDPVERIHPTLHGSLKAGGTSKTFSPFGLKFNPGNDSISTGVVSLNLPDLPTRCLLTSES